MTDKNTEVHKINDKHFHVYVKTKDNKSLIDLPDEIISSVIGLKKLNDLIDLTNK